MAAAQLRAPLYEDKVVDFRFEKADVTDRDVTREEIEAAIESEEGFSTGTHSHDHDNHKPSQKSAAKKSAAKKAPSAKRSEEHTSELQSLMRSSYAVFCLKKKNRQQRTNHT